MIVRVLVALASAALSLSAAAQLVTAGTLRSATALSGAPEGAQAYRIVFQSTDGDGASIDMTGAVIVPSGPEPTGGRNIVAWAHGTSGVADACAPSTNAWLFSSIAGLNDLLKRGYVVVAPDYQGLGGPGPHPYLAGPSAAHSVLDAVRAARAMPQVSMSNRFAVWGESQGGHASLWTAQLAASYAPELQLVAAAAAAPPVDLAANLTGNTNATVRALLTAFAAASWSEVYGIPLSTVTGPVGQDLIRRLAKNCVTLDGFKLRTKVGLVRLTNQLRRVDLNSSPRWAELMRANSVTASNLGVPLLIAQGSADVIVSPTVTQRFVRNLCRAGQPVRFLKIDGGDHISIAKRTATTTITWLDERFSRESDSPNDCGGL